MKKSLKKLLIALKAAHQLGFSQVAWYAVYQLGLRSGHSRRLSPIAPYPSPTVTLNSPYRLPDKAQVEELLLDQPGLLQELLNEADEICAGKVKLFGGPPSPLNLTAPAAAGHWTEYEGRPQNAGVEDLKLVWEPARFFWVYPLGRAYFLTQNERYPAAFWQRLVSFCQANPPNQGPNWSSAQEVALRLLALLYAARVFDGSPHTTPERRARLAGIIAAHAERIPLTLSYARAQNNNHLVSEALGLLAASRALPDHPAAGRWQKLGISNLNFSFEHQIRPDGTYVQHSANYHRLMLQAALQAAAFTPLSPKAKERLRSATFWLLAQIDPHTGRVPNLGANDGAHIFPLAAGGFADFRPVGQAAARAFTGQAAFPPGAWDEESLWLGLLLTCQPAGDQPPVPASPAVHRLGDSTSWATLRAVRFHERPSHADQLHVDLWWQGENIALDAGTYRYTAPAPWENALAVTRVHNTITIDDQNQMQRAGKFLWLDWAQAKWLPSGSSANETLTAEHDGYARLGILHRRTVARPAANQWLVTDELLLIHRSWLTSRQSKPRSFTLHWLAPDWPFELTHNGLILQHPSGGTILLSVDITQQPAAPKPEASISLVCAGKVLAGTGNLSPALGWFSPTYAQKIPALSFSYTFTAQQLPITLQSNWLLKEK